MRLDWNAQDAEGTVLDQGSAVVVKGRICVSARTGNAVLGEVYADMKMEVSADERIFLNGYQTWTVCPEYAPSDYIRGLNKVPGLLKKKYAFDRYGDYHFVRYPEKKGILHGFSWMTIRKGEHMRLLASVNERPGYTMFTLDCNTQRLHLARDCAGVISKEEYPVFDLFYAEGTEEEVYDAWFREMKIRPRTADRIAGYSSWYNRYEKIDEEGIREDLQGCRALLEPGDLFQIDDGWECRVGDWLEADPAGFPNGMKAMADEIHEAGFQAGIWLAPFVAEKDSLLFKEHPDWFLTVDGEPWKDGSNWSGFYSLDLDHPDVCAYLQKVFDRVLNEWGYDLVKLDFLYGAAPFGNARESRAGRMFRAMEMLRRWCGDKKILGCGVPVVPAFGLVDYCRVSCDVTLDWDDVWFMRMFHRERTSTRNAIANIVSRRALNGRAYLSDPDVFFLRKENIQLDEKQKRSLAVLGALCGGVFLTSDNPSSYSEEQKAAYRYLRSYTKARVLSVKWEGEQIAVCYENGEETVKEILFS